MTMRASSSCVRAATFSIVAADPATETIGVAVSSKILAVGAFCPHVRGGAGAISSQAYLNPYLGLDGLELLTAGFAPAEVLERLLADDEGRDWRQLTIVDASGRAAAYTGSRVDQWGGDVVGDGYAAAGNLLVGSETVAAMAEAFEGHRDLALEERLLLSLGAAQAAGGDRRGRQSAALKVGKLLELPYIDLRVDDHTDPVAELQRLYTLAPDTHLPLGRLVSTTREPRGPDELIARQRALQQIMDEAKG
jgi:uncharacterized Ntn-hydrolase superfamily protein